MPTEAYTTETETTKKTVRDKLRSIFDDRTSFWAYATALLTTVSLLKGLRVPNDWAATQAQLGYQEGFVKRGLFGAAVSSPLGLGHYVRFAAVSTFLLLLLLGLTVAFSRWAGISRRFGSAIVGAVYGASYGVTYLGHLNGYLDIPLAILTVGLLFVGNIIVRFLLAIPAVVVGAMIHELFLVIFLPVLLLSFLLQMQSKEGPARRHILFATGGLALLSLGATVRSAAHAPLSVNQKAVLVRDVEKHVDFQTRPDFFKVMTWSIVDNVHFMSTKQRELRWWLGQISSALTMLPTIGLLLLLMRRTLAQSFNRKPLWIFPACLIASLSPIAMGLIRLDTGRWYALAALTTFLALGAVCRYVPGPAISISPALQRAAVIAIALSMASGGAMMDHAQIFPYPFTSDSLIRSFHMQGR